MHDVEKEAVMPLFVTFVNVQGSHEYSCIEKPYKVLKLVEQPCGLRYSLRHIINYKVLKPQTSNLKPQIGHHRTHTTCDSCNLCTLLFYNQTPVAVNNMTPIFYVCQFQLPLLKKYKVYLFILSRLA